MSRGLRRFWETFGYFKGHQRTMGQDGSDMVIDEFTIYFRAQDVGQVGHVTVTSAVDL